MVYDKVLISLLCFISCSICFGVPPKRKLKCYCNQKGQHLSVNCSMQPKLDGDWDKCSLVMELPKGIYADPFELGQKGISFKIMRRAFNTPTNNDQNDNRGVLGWLINTQKKGHGEEATDMDYFGFDKKDVITENNKEWVNESASNVDVEAPEWQTTGNKWKFSLKTPLSSVDKNDSDYAVNIPLHIRYRLPRSTCDKENMQQLRRPYLDCKNEKQTIPDTGKHCKGDQCKFDIYSPAGVSNDYLLVITVTTALLLIGILVLLIS